MSVENAGVPADADHGRRERRRREILDAATKCVRRFGAKKVAVEDIAQAAGVGRRTLYRFFSGRRAIMQAVVIDRLTTLAAGVKAALRLCDGFEESIMVGTLETVRLARSDKIFESIVEDDRSLTQDDDPDDTAAPIRALTADIWAEVFRRARESGMLRPSMTETEALRWLIDVHELFEVRRDLNEEAIGEILRKFVLPSLIPDDRLGGDHPGERLGRRPG